MSNPKTELIDKILSHYRAKTKKPEEWYVEQFDRLSDQSDARLKNYLKILKQS